MMSDEADVQEREAASSQIIDTGDAAEFFVVPLRVRMSAEQEENLDRIEAYFRGKGYRHVRRSHIVRVALDRLIQDVIAEHPEVALIKVRE